MIKDVFTAIDISLPDVEGQTNNKRLMPDPHPAASSVVATDIADP
ncbi:hypothetical protein [Candidatus Nitrospira neomarina]|uniref:Uncharacterized protein n=1 Tax=Candidatus Nitrospira neomarina TaxID=3020899 RepID=A0AA96JUQ9_9BACT|nr:hypothetical protein [Candidatus Nitrospira neomarina]WNM60912.1 hypothetical protein PQG83_14245 [Candidatus Nitrospira neomarina]